MERLEIVEIIKPIESGMTQPYLCVLEDGRTYAVKGRMASRQGLIAEAVAGALGRALDLPIPEFVVALLPEALLAADLGSRPVRDLGRAPAFASLWQEPADVSSTTSLAKHSVELRASIYVFDHWVLNGDRSLTEVGGNVNLLERLADDTLVVIDHNLAFSRSYRPNELELHACRDAWQTASSSMLFELNLKHRMSKAANEVSLIIDDLPSEWTDDEQEHLLFVESTLARYVNDAFWNEL